MIAPFLSAIHRAPIAVAETACGKVSSVHPSDKGRHEALSLQFEEIKRSTIADGGL